MQSKKISNTGYHSPLVGEAGCDEAGRGCLAGPVVAAAVVLAEPIDGLADSKKLSARQRERLAVLIKASAAGWALGIASVEEIDTVNILQASLLAMRRALLSLPPAPTQEALHKGIKITIKNCSNVA